MQKISKLFSADARSPLVRLFRGRRARGCGVFGLVVAVVSSVLAATAPAGWTELTVPGLTNRTDLDYGIEVTGLSGPRAPARGLPGVPTLVDATGDGFPDLLVTVLALPAVNTIIDGLNAVVAPGQPAPLPVIPDSPSLLSGLIAIPGLLPLPPALPTTNTHAAEIAIARLAPGPLRVRVELVFVVNGQEIRVGYDGRQTTAPGGFNATARVQADNRAVAVRTALADAGPSLGILASLRPVPGGANGSSFKAAVRFAPVPRAVGFLLTQAADGAVKVDTQTDRPARLTVENLTFTEPPRTGYVGDGSTSVTGVVDQLPTTLSLAVRSALGRPSISYAANADIAHVGLTLTKQEPTTFGSRIVVVLGLTNIKARTIDFLVGADQSVSVCAGSSPSPCKALDVASSEIGTADFLMAVNAIPPPGRPLPATRDYARALIINPHAPQMVIDGHVEGISRFVLRPGRDRLSAEIKHRPGSLQLEFALASQLNLSATIDEVPALASFSVVATQQQQLRVLYDAFDRTGAPARIRSAQARIDAVTGAPALFGQVRHVDIVATDVPSHLVLEMIPPRTGATRETHLRVDTRTSAAPAGDPVGTVQVSLFDDRGVRALPAGVDGVRYYEQPAPRPDPGYSIQGRATGLRRLELSTRSTCGLLIGSECQEVVDAELDTAGGRPGVVDLHLPKARTTPGGTLLLGADRVWTKIDALPAAGHFNLTSSGALSGLAGFVPSETKASWNASATTPALTLDLNLFEGARTTRPLRIAPLPANLTFCRSVDIRCLPEAEFNQYFRPDNANLPLYRHSHSAFHVDATDADGLTPVEVNVSTELCTQTRTDGTCAGDIFDIPELRLSRIKYYSGPRREGIEPPGLPNNHLIVDTDALPLTGRLFLGVDPSRTLSLFASGLWLENRVIATSVLDFYGAGAVVCPSGTRVFAAGIDVTLKFCASAPPNPI